MLQLKQSVTYGPVPSRRLGRSLGINILPRIRKTCTFDCVYCQYGWTECSGPDERRQIGWPSVGEIVEETGKKLATLSPPPAYITLSGNGEPTMHPDFPIIVECLTRLRNRYCPTAKTAILSNASTLEDGRVRAALTRLDVRVLKLDAGDQAVLDRYNRPTPSLAITTLVGLLGILPDVTIQSLFTAGDGGNLGPSHIRDWIDCIAAISPIHVQLYTLDRPYPSRDIAPADKAALTELAGALHSLGISAAVY